MVKRNIDDCYIIGSALLCLDQVDIKLLQSIKTFLSTKIIVLPFGYKNTTFNRYK